MDSRGRIQTTASSGIRSPVFNIAGEAYCAAQHQPAMRGFGVASEFRGLHDVAERSAFLLDAEGVVRGVWRYETSEVPDVDELLEAARALTPS